MVDPLHICISENRQQDEVGVKLLILSLTKHEPTAIIHLFIDDLSQGLKEWLSSFKNAQCEHLAIDPSLGWNIKAKVLFKLFSDGMDSVVWLDSDIILTAPISRFFFGLKDETFITAEEYYTFRNQGVLTRTRGWGLVTGRELPFTPNNCIIRATKTHISFLKEWQTLLDTPEYRKVQADSWEKRPFYMMGDQDVMSALMGSAQFSDMDIRRIRRGPDIAQCFGPDGYSPTERLQNLWRLPPFVHAQGGKPWRLDAGSKTYHYVSPYWYAAHAYFDDLRTEERGWLENRPPAAKLLHWLSFGNPNLAGFLPSLHFLVIKRIKAIFRILKRSRFGPS